MLLSMDSRNFSDHMDLPQMHRTLLQKALACVIGLTPIMLPDRTQDFTQQMSPVPMVLQTSTSPNLETIAEGPKESKSPNIEKLIDLAFERNRDKEFVKDNGTMFQHISDPSETDPSKIKDYVLIFSPKWCVDCAWLIPLHQKMFEERFLKRENHPAMVVFKSLGEPGDPNDPNERFYEFLKLGRYPASAIAKRNEKTNELEIVYVNRIGDAGVGKLGKDIDKYLYEIDHGPAFVNPIWTAMYEDCEPVIDAFTVGVSDISVSKKDNNNPIIIRIGWRLDEPSQFSRVLHHDRISIGEFAHDLDDLKKEIWRETLKESVPAIPEDLVKRLFRRYFSEEKAERLINDPSKWRDYFASLTPSDPTLFDILIYPDTTRFLEGGGGESYPKSIVSGDDYDILLKDLRAYHVALSKMNNHNIPQKIREYRDAYIEFAKGNYNGTSNSYRFPSNARDDFETKMIEFGRAHGAKVEFYDLPSDAFLKEQARSQDLDNDGREQYLQCLITARDEKREFYNRSIHRDTPYEVLVSMIADHELSIVSRANYSGDWGKEFDALVERNQSAIDAGQLGILPLEVERGKIGPFPLSERAIGSYLLDHGFPPEMNTGAIVVTPYRLIGGIMDDIDLKKFTIPN